MKYLKIFLLVLIAAELVVIVRKSLETPPAPLPDSNTVGLESEVAESIRELEKKLDRRDKTSWIFLGDRYRAFGMLPEAVYCYEQVDPLDPKETRHLYYWALCHSRMGNLDESEKLFMRTIKAVPPPRMQAHYAMLRMGQDYLRQGKPDLAKEQLRKSVQISSSKIWLCRLLIRQGSLPEAIALLKITADQYPRSIRAHQLLAVAFERQGDSEKARVHYEQAGRCTTAIETDEPVRGEDEQILGQYGSPFLQLESYKLEQKKLLSAALRTSRKALAIAWKEDYALQNSLLLMKNNRPEEAVKGLQECIQRAGDSAESLQLLGDAWRAAKKPQEAIKVWERAAAMPASRRPFQDITIREKLVKVYREVNGDAKKTKRHEGFVHFARGKMAYLTNVLKEAQMHLEKAVALIPDEPIAWFYLAEACRHDKSFDRAEQAYQRCLKLNPNHGRAIRGLANLPKDRKLNEQP